MKMGKADKYFLAEIEKNRDISEEVIASGYFRTYMRGRGAGVVMDAFSAQGHYIALTKEDIYIIKTRASASSKTPLLENKGSEIIALDSIDELHVNSEALVLKYGESVLPLEMVVKNKNFPNQTKLLDVLIEKYDQPISTDEILKEKRNKFLTTIALIGAIFGGVFLVNALK